MWKLDVDAFSEEWKEFTKLSLAETAEDQPVAIWHVCTYCRKFGFKDSQYTTQILPDMLVLSPRNCQCMR